jgi:hypothetical protein
MATQVFKIALPGYDASTDTNPDHFSLYVDQSVDYILIKEKQEGIVSVTTTTSIAHNLGYVPFCLVFVETSAGVWRKLFSRNIDGATPYFSVNTTNLVLNNSGGAKNFAYYIFYDNLT